MPWTFFNSSGEALTNFGPTVLTDIDVANGSDVGAALADGDEILIYDTSASANKKSDVSRIATYIGTAMQAVQSDIEAQTNQDKYIPPDLLKHNPGVGKFWVNVPANGVVSISAANSTNVASVDDDGTGARGVNLTVAFASTTFAALASGDTLHAAATIINASDVLVGVYNTSHAAADSVTQAGGFGDQ